VKISNSRIFLSGASTGIGAALALQLSQQGAHLALVSRKTHSYALPNSIWISADLSKPEDRQRAVAEAIGFLGTIDILINNAGVGLYQATKDVSSENWDYMAQLNLHAPVHLTQLLLPAMLARRSGAIVNISSIAALTPLPWFTLYSTTKAALLCYTHGLRMELAQTGVSAMAVCPGYVKTPFQQNVLGGRPPAVLQSSKKFAISPEHCARDICRGIERGSRTVITPFSGHFLHLAYFLFPSLIDALYSRYNRNLQEPAR
jgi:short-subunit dehydrogenase